MSAAGRSSSHPVGTGEPTCQRNRQFAPEPVLPEPVRQRIIALAAAALTGAARRRAAGPAAPGRQVRAQPPGPARRRGHRRPARRRPAVPAADRRPGRDRRRRPGRRRARAASRRPPPTRSRSPRWPTWPGPAGWRELIDAAGDAVARRGRQRRRRRPVRDAEQRAARAEHDRAVARVEADKLRDELARLRDELGQLREEARASGQGAARGAGAQQKRATELLATEKGRAATGARRPRRRAAPAAGQAGRGRGARPAAARQAAKEARAVDDARLWLLLETIGQAAVGLRRELALDPADDAAGRLRRRRVRRPARRARPRPARALDTDDPARLDQLLALPKAHLIVDGYNVTKRGFGEMSLEQQRNRLITGAGRDRRADRRRGHRGLRRRRAGARAAAGAARRAGAVLPQGRDRRRADPPAGPGRAGRAGRSWWSPPTARSPTAYAATAPTRWARTRCCAGWPGPDRSRWSRSNNSGTNASRRCYGLYTDCLFALMLGACAPARRRTSNTFRSRHSTM